MTLVAIGAAVGLAGAAALTRLMQSLLYGVSPLDLWTFLGASALLGLVALLAAYYPAYRASRTDVASILRST